MAAVKAGEVFADFYAKTEKFLKENARAIRGLDKTGKQIRRTQKDIQRFNKQARAAAKGIGALAAAVGVSKLVGGLVSATKRSAELATKIVEAGRNTGLLATEFEAIAAILEQDGIGFKATETALATLQKRMGEAEDGLTTAQRAFEHLGLSWSALAQLSPKQQFIEIAEAIGRMEDQTRRQQVSQDLLGRAGKLIVGTLMEQRGQWAQLIGQYDAATRATDAQYERTKELTGAFTELQRQLDDMQIRHAADNAGTILAYAERIYQLKAALQTFFLDLLTWIDGWRVSLLKLFRTMGQGLAFIAIGATKDALEQGVAEIDAAIAKIEARLAAASLGPLVVRATPSRLDAPIGYGDQPRPAIPQTGPEDFDIGQLDSLLTDDEWATMMERVKEDAEAVAAALEAAADEQARLAAENLQRIEQAWENVAQTIRTGLVQGLQAVIFQAEDLGDLLKGVLRQILQAITQALLLESITKAAGGGGLIGSFLGALGFSGAAGGGFHTGLTLVGEKGPELADFGGRGAMVYTARQTAEMMGGGGGVRFGDIYVQGVQDPTAIRKVLYQELPDAFQRFKGELMDEMQTGPNPFRAALADGVYRG